MIIKNFWGESFLAVVIPNFNVFYIREMKSLLPECMVYNANRTFNKFQDVFERVKPETQKNTKKK